MMRGEINGNSKFVSAGNRNQQAGSLRSPEPRLYPDCKQLTLQTAAATAPQFSALASAFDDFGGQQYDKVWRTSVLRVIVSFLFRITIRWINARGTWCLVAGQ
jgi:hypothetical protein